MALWGSGVRDPAAPPSFLKMDGQPVERVCVDTAQPRRFAEGVTLGQAILSLLIAKKAANLRPRYLTSLRIYLNAFARGRESAPVSSIDVFELENWFAGRSEAPSTMLSNLGRLAALFSFCERRGWINKSPTVFIEKPKVDRKPPRILTPDEAHALINFIRSKKPHALPYFTLAMFAGVRPEELERITWDHIDLGRKILTVDAAASKVRKRRIVDLHDSAVSLLAESKGRGGRLPIGKQSRRRFIGAACGAIGLDAWPQDVLRHSAASYLVAAHGDVGRVSMWLGNSPGILLNHYRELVRKEDAEKFFAVKPTAS